MFKNKFKVLYRGFSFLLCVLAIPVHAISIGFSPASPTVFVGDFFDVDLVISELGSGAAPSVGFFDFDIGYIPTVLSVEGVSFGSFLGGNNSTQEFLRLPTPGFINLVEISTLLATDLDALQPDIFPLATLTFAAIAPGESAINFSRIVIQDAVFPDPTNLTITPESGNVTVQAVAAVPEPNALMLFGVGIFTMAMSRKRRQSPAERIRNLLSPSSKKA